MKVICFLLNICSLFIINLHGLQIKKEFSSLTNRNNVSSALVLKPGQKQLLSQTIEFNFPIFGQESHETSQQQQQQHENFLSNEPIIDNQQQQSPNYPFIYPPSSSSMQNHFNEYLTTANNFPSYSSDKEATDVEKTYDYILRLRKVVSCPSFASFKFSCQTNHLISIENLIFSPVVNKTTNPSNNYYSQNKATNKTSKTSSSSAINNNECISDWSNECTDSTISASFEYLSKECSGKETCTLIAYNLRSKTKCQYHQVISIYYKCVPTWEINNVPIKCDICKNVTLLNPDSDAQTTQPVNHNYGFIHSAMYPKLYPRTTCHSFIRNKPDHFIIVYSVSGSIGLDRIQVESVNEQGFLMLRELLTGNLTTRLVLTSPYDVNVTVLTEDTYFYGNRRFLLYFYLVPKCYVILCANMTALPPLLSYPSIPYNSRITYSSTLKTTETTTTRTNNNYIYQSQHHEENNVYYNNQPSIQSIQTPMTSLFYNTTTNVANSTYDHALHDQNGHRTTHSSKISDAWLAAILALVYALLMVFAVIAAIYCRRRRRQQLMENYQSYHNSSHLINNTSSFHGGGVGGGDGSSKLIYTPSTSQILNPMMMSTRSQSQLSLSQSFNNNANNNIHHNLYHLNQSAPPPSHHHLIPIHSTSSSSHFDYNNLYSHVTNNNNNTNEEEFDQRFNENDHYNSNYNYAYNNSENLDINYSQLNNNNTNTNNQVQSQYSLKTDTKHGSILAAVPPPLNLSRPSSASFYRAVEYTKSPHLECVRVRTSSPSSSSLSHIEQQQKSQEQDEMSEQNIIIHHNHHHHQSQEEEEEILTETFRREETVHQHRHLRFDHEENSSEEQIEKTFVVKLFPLDEQEKEVQEMTMYVQHPNQTISRNGHFERI